MSLGKQRSQNIIYLRETHRHKESDKHTQLQQSNVEKYNNYLENTKVTDLASVVYENNCKILGCL